MKLLKTPRADLEGKKFIFREIGLIIALLVAFFAFSLKTPIKKISEFEGIDLSLITEEIIPVTLQESKPLPLPPPQQATKISIVENDVEVENNIELNVEASQETVIEEYIPYVPLEEEEEEVIEEEPVFVIVESMPSFPGGARELMKYLNKNLRYPALAKETGIQGKVFITFVVEKDGSVTDVSVLRGIGGGCDKEAIRVVESMPNWIPGRQRNVLVRVRFNLPVKFRLQ